MQLYSLQILILCFLPLASAFFGKKPARTAAKTSPFTDEALAIYDKKYPFGREPPKPNPLKDFGMPYTDIDGTRVRSKNPSKQRLTDISPDRAKAAFNELARLYGDERALQIVKAQPLCLAFEYRNFAMALDNYAEVFGLEESQEMIARNPGLLAVRPDEAAKATDSTMVFSYLVGFTRPLGPVLLATLFFLLLTPTIESLTGVQYGINH